jgi:hypothetical protein
MPAQNINEAGPSRPPKPKKTAAKHAKSVKAKKLSEKQKIEALERDVMNYVGEFPLCDCSTDLGMNRLLQRV